MAKLKTKLMGRQISGPIGRDLTFYTVKGQTRVRTRVTPTDPKTPARLTQRGYFQGGVECWHTLTAEEKEYYHDLDPGIGTNAAYLNFIKEWLMGTVPVHAERHQDAGADEINIQGLSGELSDPQTPKTHHESHETGGGDAISIAGLPGEPAELASHKILKTDVHGVGAKYVAAIASEGAEALPLTELLRILKTADQIINNSDTLQNDDHLLFAMGANEVWQVLVIPFTISASVGPHMKLSFSVPSGADLNGLGIGVTVGNVLKFVRMPLGAIDTFYVHTVTYVNIWYQMVVINGATPGNFQLQWAQNTATAEDTTMKADSCLIAHRLA